MRTNLNKLSKILALTIICIIILSIPYTVSANTISDSNNTEPTTNKTYEYYGIIQGNGTQSTIYLKVGNNWELYTIQSDYIGYTCKLIVIDDILTTDNYKDITIINIKDIDNKHSQQANETIHDWNNYILHEGE